MDWKTEESHVRIAAEALGTKAIESIVVNKNIRCCIIFPPELLLPSIQQEYSRANGGNRLKWIVR